MGFLSSIFGSSPKSSVSSMPTLSPEQQALLKSMISQGTEAGSAGMFETPLYKAYGGPTVAGPSALESASLSALEEYSKGLLSGGSKPRQDALDAWGAGLQRTGTGAAEYYKTNVENPVMRTLQEQVIPGLTKRFSGNAAFGSDRRLAEQQALTRVGEDLQRGQADYLQGQNNQLAQLLGLTDMMSQGEMNDITTLLKAGALPRELEQARLSTAQEEYRLQEQSKQDYLKALLQLLGIQTTENVVQQTGGSSGLLGGLASGGAFNSLIAGL